jgi:hypothetical protein
MKNTILLLTFPVQEGSKPKWFSPNVRGASDSTQIYTYDDEKKYHWLWEFNVSRLHRIYV